jgi:hypothetical protein
MAYQGLPVSSRIVPLSKLWRISLLITWLIIFIISAGLLGASASPILDCSSSYDSSYDYYYCGSKRGNMGLLYGGIAYFAIGGAVKLAY